MIAVAVQCDKLKPGGSVVSSTIVPNKPSKSELPALHTQQSPARLCWCMVTVALIIGACIRLRWNCSTASDHSAILFLVLEKEKGIYKRPKTRLV